MPALKVSSKSFTQQACNGRFIGATGFLFSLALLLAPAAVKADAHEAKLLVTATVMKHASLKVLSQPASVTVTAADIRLGYVDVPVPAQVAVQSNTQAGYMLLFKSQGEFIRQILVRGLGTDVQLGPSGGGVMRAAWGRGMSKTKLDMVFRFELSDSAQQGVYAWPMRYSVTPL